MVRGVSIRLKKIQAKQHSSLSPQKKRQTATNITGFIPRSRFAQIRTQERRQRIALDNVINKITNLTNINDITLYSRAACDSDVGFIIINDTEIPCEVFSIKKRVDRINELLE